MGKQHKKDKTSGKDKKHKKESADAGSNTAGNVDTGAYSDGHPQDRVQYLEAKLILKPDHFTSVDSFRDFGKLVQRTAKKLGVGFITDPKIGLRPDVREIIFFDTSDFRLLQQRLHSAAAHNLR